MKTLVKPTELEEQYQSIESYCTTRKTCGSCSGESSNNPSPDSDDDILF